MERVAAFHRFPKSNSAEVKRFPLDKENRTFASVTLTTTPSKSARVDNEPVMGGPSMEYRSAPSSPIMMSTGSKVLQHYWHQVHQSAGKQQPPRSAGTPSRRRLLDSGAVRVDHHSSRQKPCKTASTRVGYDGTHNTPSKELLRSTASSRNQSIRPPQQQLSPQALFATTTVAYNRSNNNDDEVDLLTLQSSHIEDPSLETSFEHAIAIHPPSLAACSSPNNPGRTDCVNPVAWTLLHRYNDENEGVHGLHANSPAPVRVQIPMDVPRPRPQRPMLPKATVLRF